MKRTPLARKTRLQAKTAMKRGRKPLPKVNARQAKKRAKRMRKWYASAAWKRQRQESLELAGHRCQYHSEYQAQYGDGTRLSVDGRCGMADCLQVHELRYKFEKSTPHDRIVLCKTHHELVEQRDHPTRRRGRSA